MPDDSCLKQNPMYAHLFEDKKPPPKVEVHWLKPIEGIVNSRCGLYQVRRQGDPPVYSLYSIRVLPFARLIRDGFDSFASVREFLQRPDKSL